MEKNPQKWVKYDLNEPPQPQLVGFRNLVGVGIAPLSKKTAVKYVRTKLNHDWKENGIIV